MTLQAHPQRPEAHPLTKWLFPLGGALLSVGLVGGYLAGMHRSSTGAGMSIPVKGSRGMAPAGVDQTSTTRTPEMVQPDGESQPAPERLSAKEARDREVARLLASGPDARNLTVDALRLGKSWSRAAQKEGVDLEFDDWKCYRAGCVTGVQHAPDVLGRVTRAISTDDAFVGWGGEKFRSGPIEQPDGKVEVTWILYAPPDGAAALVMADDPQTLSPPASK